mgnify:CR=1 FL=1
MIEVTTKDASTSNTPTNNLDNVQELIRQECEAVKEMLLVKNRKYGNSAMRPLGVFSKLHPREQINVRLDDKLKRLQSLQPDDQKDTKLDIIGYLILDRVLTKLEAEGKL